VETALYLRTRRWLQHGVLAAIAIGPVLGHAALVDRGGGLLYDTVLDVTWLQDANYARTLYESTGGASGTLAGTMDWNAATAWVADLSYYDSVRNVSWTDWRLPTLAPVNGSSFQDVWSTNGTTDLGYNITSTQSELAFMYYVNLGLTAGLEVPNTTVLTVNGVSVYNFENRWYWFGVEYPFSTGMAWDFLAAGGAQSASVKTSTTHLAWAVRDGDVAGTLMVSEPGSMALVLAAFGLGTAASRVRRVRRPLQGSDKPMRWRPPQTP
jgi:hypothetical protein